VTCCRSATATTRSCSGVRPNSVTRHQPPSRGDDRSASPIICSGFHYRKDRLVSASFRSSGLVADDIAGEKNVRYKKRPRGQASAANHPGMPRPALGWRIPPHPTWSPSRSDVMSGFDRCFNLPAGKGAENTSRRIHGRGVGIGCNHHPFDDPIKKERSNS
jgi:hypothetical protein